MVFYNPDTSFISLVFFPGSTPIGPQRPSLPPVFVSLSISVSQMFVKRCPLFFPVTGLFNHAPAHILPPFVIYL